MSGPSFNSYLETEVMTASPQRLRLMLIDAAVRLARDVGWALTAGLTAGAVVATVAERRRARR